VRTDRPLPADRLDPSLRSATANLGTVVAAAVEAGAARIEPSHFLIALARVPGSLTGRLFAGARIPVDVFAIAMREQTPAGVAVVVELSSDTASSATRRLIDELDGHDGPIDESALLAAALTHLEPAAREVLEHHGGADLAEWRAVAERGPVTPATVWRSDGRLDEAAFTPAAARVLDSAVTEAAALGIRSLSTLLLTHAMAIPEQGLLAQGAVHARFDLRDLRGRLLMLLRGDGRRGAAPERVTRDGVAPAFRLALEHAARVAAARGSAVVAEQDLLEALIGVPGSPVSGVLRASGVDLPALKRFAADIYTEPEVEPEPTPESVSEALERFQRQLIGQPAVGARLLPRLELIKRAVRRGFRMGDRPLATFLFCGPSGTGKTMTARLIAEAVYGSTDDLIMFEMGQYNSRHAISNFIGAPPGYVGFGEGKLTNGLARTPRCVLLFDEVEKADRLVLDALLRLLDEGRVTDPAGPVRDAREAVVVLTSNVGARWFAALGRRASGLDAAPSGLRGELAEKLGSDLLPDEEEDEAEVSRRLRSELERFLRPEFLNRIDEAILFAPFTRDDLRDIAEATLQRRAGEVLGELGVRLEWSPDVCEHVVEQAVTTRVDEAARGVVRCADAVLGLLLRFLDEADDRGEQPTAARVVVRDGALAVIAAHG
jgi:ATP-dependent Clp protease ATP-binding subunit ClpC